MPQSYLKKGFTLIELLVVIVVIGILASLATVGMKSARSKASDSKKVSEIRSLSTALEMYMMDEGKYPANIQNMWGQPLVGPTSGKTYMTLPKQLTGGSYGTYCRGNDSIYIYNWINNGASYTISYCLDNPMNGCAPGPKTARPNLIMDCENQTSACLPSCTRNDGTIKECGDNGCGGSCGGCGGSLVCNGSAGKCVACNGDGDCGTNQHCNNGTCVPCIDDGDCLACQRCDTSVNPTECKPLDDNTTDNRCYNIGCSTNLCISGSCHINTTGESCTGGNCNNLGECCTPNPCPASYTCGTIPNSCSPFAQAITCGSGTCAVGSCTNNQCCTPAASNVAACTTAGVVSCGGESVPNGTCPDSLTCASSICASTANTKKCDPTTKKCVECTADTDCGACKRCSNNACVNIAANTADSRCSTSGTCYTGTCNGSGSCNIYNDNAVHGCVTSGGYANRRCTGNTDGSCSCTASACGGLTGVAPGYSNGCGGTCNSACTDCGSTDGYCHQKRAVYEYTSQTMSSGYCDSCGGGSCGIYCNCCSNNCADLPNRCFTYCRSWRSTANYSLGTKSCSSLRNGSQSCNCSNMNYVCP